MVDEFNPNDPCNIEKARTLPIDGAISGSIAFYIQNANTTLTLNPLNGNLFKAGDLAEKISLGGKLTYMTNSGAKPLAGKKISLWNVYPNTAGNIVSNGQLLDVGLLSGLLGEVETNQNGEFAFATPAPLQIGIYTLYGIYGGEGDFGGFNKSETKAGVNIVTNNTGTPTCPYDGITFATEQELLAHIAKTHTGGVSQQCPNFLPWQGPGSIVRAVICRFTGQTG